MAATNTGRKIYANLQQIYVDTGLPTAEEVKANDPDDPDYVPPVTDLVTCPPPDAPVPHVIQIAVQFINNTSQSIQFSNFVVKGASVVNVNDAYFHSDPFSLLPGQTINAPVALQYENLSNVSFTFVNMSGNIPIHMNVNYKIGIEPTGTPVFNIDIAPSTSLSAPLSTTRDTSADMTNSLVITFTPA